MLVKPQRKHGPKAEMNVVPYIDVMLVLLVIFMVTAPMLTQGVKIELPKVASEALANDRRQQILTLSVKAEGGYYWNLGGELDTTTRPTAPWTWSRCAPRWRRSSPSAAIPRCTSVPTRMPITVGSLQPWPRCNRAA